MFHRYLSPAFLFYISITPLSAYLINFQRHQEPQTIEDIDRKYFPISLTDRSCTPIPGDKTQALSSIRIRGDSTLDIGAPPQAIAFFTGNECNDTTVSAIVRFYQVSTSIEQSISPTAIRTNLAEGLGWDATFTATSLYDYYQNVGYTSTLWGAVVSLGLQQGDIGFKYTSEDGSVDEWRVAIAIIAMEEEPYSLGEGSMMPPAYYDRARALSLSLPQMAEDERIGTRVHFQEHAEKRPIEENVLLDEDPALIDTDPESAWRNRIVHDHERKIKIGKLARAASNYGPAPIRKYNPNMMELNPLVNLVGQTNLEDLERQKAWAVNEYLNDRDWDLYLPESNA
ncbi:hypothetical protein TWF506_011121 [Arthrobotrys conoides]|uniref:Uncharacterized protein n=1 Tax=Arthrobotrys conoides TaxID=74498 RepID=A0AAN8NJ78_9PEZI